MLIIGSHVSYGKNALLGATEEALSYNANTFMFYTGAPTNTMRSNIDIDNTNQAQKLMLENGIDINNVIVHAPYIVNPATNDIDKHIFTVNFLKQEIKRCSVLGIKYMVLHPGSAINEDRQTGIYNIVKTLNEILNEDNNVTILIETMAGKGNELGINIDEIKAIIDNTSNKQLLGVCLDTCHLNDAGIDLNSFDKYLDEFDKKIGISKIRCVHINDSKNIIGSHKDRHMNIGFGTIGYDLLAKIIYNSRLDNIPKILETPYIGNDDNDKEKLYPPYKFEIEMIRNNQFDSDLFNKIRNYYRK